jgi:hypothetical protein
VAVWRDQPADLRFASDRQAMSQATTPAVFDRCRARIEELLEGHADMSVVERTIDDQYALDRDQKDALWLWASGRRTRLISDPADGPFIGDTSPARARDPRDNLRYPTDAHD